MWPRGGQEDSMSHNAEAASVRESSFDFVRIPLVSATPGSWPPTHAPLFLAPGPSPASIRSLARWSSLQLPMRSQSARNASLQSLKPGRMRIGNCTPTTAPASIITLTRTATSRILTLLSHRPHDVSWPAPLRAHDAGADQPAASPAAASQPPGEAAEPQADG